MGGLANAFSVLELDADDSRLHFDSVASPAAGNTSASGRSDKRIDSSADTSLVKGRSDKRTDGSADTSLVKGRSGKSVDGSADTSLVKHEKENQQSIATLSSEYKLPLVWIDLEMTGLNTEVDRILEIACIITDGSLTKTVEGPDLVIHQTKECLDKMGEWCQSHHAASGLTKKVLHSTISEREAEKQVIDFVKRNVGSYTPLLAGNSIYVDFLFLKKYMPELAALFSHVVVDVSSVKALCIRWYPRDQKKAPVKENKHRALDDIRESIEELRYYKANIFKPKSRK